MIPAPAGCCRPAAGAQDGFTMIEMVISALLVALLIAAAATSLIGSAHLSADQRHRSTADALAQQDQERLRGLSAQELTDANGQQRTQTVDGTTYTVTTTTKFLSSSGGSSCASTGSQAAAYYRTSSSVNWLGNLRTPVVEDSLVTPPAGGTILAEVEDQTGSPVAGVGVSASGPDDETASTNSEGCTVLAGLTAGTYTLTLAKSGYVDLNGYASPPGLSATVTSSGTATPSGGNPVKLAPAGNISVTFTAQGTSGSVPGQADTFSWIGTGASEQMASARTYSPLASAPVGSLPASGTQALYPFAFSGPSYTNNYQAWGGKCTQMQPPSGTDMFSVAPASTSTLSVQEPALGVFVTYGGSRVAPSHVKLTFTSSTGVSCSDSWYPAVAADAATDANGALASPGQPYVSSSSGSLAICADYANQEATVSGQSNSSFTGLNSVTVPLTSTSASGTC